MRHRLPGLEPSPPGARGGGRRRSTVLLPGLAGLLAGLLAVAHPGSAAAAPDSERAVSDPLRERWRWVRFGREHGLPSDDVFGVAVSATGRTWAFTRQGPAWLDGGRWVGTSVEGEPGPLDAATALSQGPSGLALLGVRDLQLEEAPERDRSRLVRVPLPDGMDACGGVAEARGHGLVAVCQRSADRGVAAFVRVQERWEPWPLPLPAGARGSARLLGAAGALWLFFEGGAWRFSREDGWSRRIPDGRVQQPLALIEPGAGEPALLALLDAAGQARLWQVPLRGDDEPRPVPGTPAVRQLCAGPGGSVLALADGGVASVRRAGAWAPLEPCPEPLAAARSAAFRPDGALWVATAHGLYLARAQLPAWQLLAESDRAPGGRVHAVATAPDGTVWLATSCGVLEARPGAAVRRHDVLAEQRCPVVTGIAVDDAGDVWAVSGSAFPGALRHHAGTWTVFGAAEGLGAPRVHRVRRASGGGLWFLGMRAEYQPEGPAASAEPGAFLWRAGRMTTFPERAAPGQPGLLSGRVYEVVEAADGSVWFATREGLSRWAAGAWTHLTEADGLPSRSVTSLAEDGEGRLWFGSARGGAGWVEDGRVHRVPPGHALDRREILGLSRDASGAVWAALDEGAAYQGPAGWTRLTPDDGLPPGRVYCVDTQAATLWLGTLGHGAWRLPRAALPAPRPHRVVIEHADVDAEGRLQLSWGAYAEDGAVPPGDIEVSLVLGDSPPTPWSSERHVTASARPGVARTRLAVLSRSRLGEFRHPELGRELDLAPDWSSHPAYLALIAALSLLVLALLLLLLLRRRGRARDVAEQALQAERLASVRALAGGLAHDFNNLLVGVLGNADLALRTLPPGASERPLLAGVVESARHASALTAQLLTISGRRPLAAQPLDVAQALRDLAGALRTAAGPLIHLELDLPDEPVRLRGDRVALGQAVTALVGSAAEALGARSGRVLVRVRPIPAGAARSDPGEPTGARAAGQAVSIEVADDGPEIPPEALPRLFDPFFTARGQRRGLGLAVVRGVVESHHGSIRVRSSAAAGTSIQLLLPWAEERPAPRSAAAPRLAAWSGSGSVLVVDDEPQVRAVMSEVVRGLGFHVLEAHGGREALDALAAPPPDLRALVLDLSMPDISGEEVLAEARRLLPGLAVLLVTGSAPVEDAEPLRAAGAAEVLAKPFTLAQFVEALRRTLGAAPASPAGPG